jgi:hypothetical protein
VGSKKSEIQAPAGAIEKTVEKLGLSFAPSGAHVHPTFSRGFTVGYLLTRLRRCNTKIMILKNALTVLRCFLESPESQHQPRQHGQPRSQNGRQKFHAGLAAAG